MYYILLCGENKGFVDYMQCIFDELGINKSETQFWEFDISQKLISYFGQRVVKCDLLILDMNMSDVNAYETALFLRKMCPDAMLVFASDFPHPQTEKKICSM